MKKLIVTVGILLSFSVFALDVALEPQWKTSLRNFVSSLAGGEWGNKLVGVKPLAPAPAFDLPAIPSPQKKNTDIESYSKQSKELTQYDNLPKERRKQFDYKFIQELFMVTRKTEAKDEDLSNWLNVLEQGGSREGIYQALVLDEVYSGLEGMEEKPSEKLLSFCLNFSQKFFQQTFKKEALGKLNLYSLKRIFSEKGLDVMEVYETKNLDDLYKWYAVFSSDMAAQYPEFVKSEVREDTRPEYHYQWAKSMPVQHIKSEFIIKLHSVMNGLELLE